MTRKMLHLHGALRRFGPRLAFRLETPLEIVSAAAAQAPLNYAVDQILYLPKGTKSAPKKAADPEKGQVAAAAIGSINFSL